MPILATATKLKEWADAHEMRPDWHEPDEQGVTARVVGRTLDNAFGDRGMVLPGDVECCEMLVVLKDADGNTLTVNLATVLANAAMAAP
jgi:hypothetical protein